MWIIAWTVNHGDNELEDHWVTRDTQEEAIEQYKWVLTLDDLHLACMGPILIGTEPQYTDYEAVMELNRQS